MSLPTHKNDKARQMSRALYLEYHLISFYAVIFLIACYCMGVYCRKLNHYYKLILSTFKRPYLLIYSRGPPVGR